MGPSRHKHSYSTYTGKDKIAENTESSTSSVDLRNAEMKDNQYHGGYVKDEGRRT